MNREKRTLILSGIAVVVASLLFLYFYTGEPPVTNVGVQVGSNQTQGSSDAIDMSDEVLRSQVLMTASKDPLNFTDNVKVAAGQGSGVSTSVHHGGGGGGSGDTTPPKVTGLFSRGNDTIDGWYTHPVTITWVGDDGPSGSGIRSCEAPVTYSGPDKASIVREGHCTDNRGNLGTGRVTFNYNSTATGNLAHSYSLSLNSSEISVGSDISATATTNNTSIKNVKFIWKDPVNVVSSNHTKPTIATTGNNRNSIDLFTAPSNTGVWLVEAHFLDTTNNDVIILTERFFVIQPGGGGASPFAYGLTVNPETVEKNHPVTANATTNNTGITIVRFLWTDPNGAARASQNQTLSSKSVLDSFTPDIIGKWRVDAHFNNATHSDIAIRLKDFDVFQVGPGPDTTPPKVTGVFSREPDIKDNSNTFWYTHPVTIKWEGDDGPSGSGIAFCDDPITYSGPNAAGIIREGHCTDKAPAHNVGTGNVTFNYDSSATGQLLHFYDLSLSSNSVNLGSSISANATTNNTSIKDVRFVWRNPLNATAANNTISTIAHNDLRTAVNLFAGLNQTGIWSVNAHFLDNATNDVFEITKIFSVVQQGGELFAYDLTVTPETVEKNHEVKANATSDNPTITNVTIVWRNPLNATAAIKVIPMPAGSATFRSVIDLFSPDSIGEWRVDAHFNNATHSDVAIRFEFFTVIKEGGGGTGNHPPVADAGPDQIVNERAHVDLSGLGSSDPDGDALAYSWKQTKGPTVELREAHSATPSFKAPSVDEEIVLTFELTVSDPFGAESTDSLNIKVLDTSGNGGGGGGGDNDNCNDEGQGKGKHGEKDSDSDDGKCKCSDDDEHKGGSDGGCSDGDHDDDNENNGGSDKGNGGNHGGSGSEDRNDSGKDEKDRENNDSEKGADNSDQQSGGSHDNSGSKGEHGGSDDKNSGGSNDKGHDSSGEADRGSKGFSDHGSGHDNKGNDEKGSSGKGSGSHDSGSGDKGGKKGSDHDKKNSGSKHPVKTTNDAKFTLYAIESWFRIGLILFSTLH